MTCVEVGPSHSSKWLWGQRTPLLNFLSYYRTGEVTTSDTSSISFYLSISPSLSIAFSISLYIQLCLLAWLSSAVVHTSTTYSILYAVYTNIKQVSLRKSSTLYGKFHKSTIFYIIYLTNLSHSPPSKLPQTSNSRPSILGP